MDMETIERIAQIIKDNEKLSEHAETHDGKMQSAAMANCIMYDIGDFIQEKYDRQTKTWFYSLCGK